MDPSGSSFFPFISCPNLERYIDPLYPSLGHYNFDSWLTHLHLAFILELIPSDTLVIQAIHLFDLLVSIAHPSVGLLVLLDTGLRQEGYFAAYKKTGH